jgi:hypothetical protein
VVIVYDARMRNVTLFGAALLFGLALAINACSSEGKVGEECDEGGKTEGECESGGVCGKQTSGALQCLKICTVQTDCAADQECNGVEGTNTKGCRTKSGSGGSSGSSGTSGGGDSDGGKK